MFPTPEGILFFRKLGVLKTNYGDFFACIDGTENKPHLAGKAADDFLQILLRKEYIKKKANCKVLEISAIGIKLLKGNNE